MKYICLFVLISSVSSAQTKTYRFIGKFLEFDYADGYYWYTFADANGKTKEFIQLDTWAPLTYNLHRPDLSNEKWFDITYVGVYDRFGDLDEKVWFRRIKTIELSPIPGTTLFKFVGKFSAASVLEGSGHYTFIGLDDRPKKFAHDTEWAQQLAYDFFDFDANTNQWHVGKWFRITYYGVYGVLSGEDGAAKTWHRKIYTIEMIPIPDSKKVEVRDTSRLYDLNIVKGMACFAFQDGPNTYMETKCDTSELKNFRFDFTQERVFSEKYYNHLFAFKYFIEYDLEDEEPVTRRILSLKVLD